MYPMGEAARAYGSVHFMKTTIALLLLAGSALAQVTASISGRAEDIAGAGVENATITVTSLETGATRVVQTEPDGRFRVLSLPVGPQEIKAEKNGFRSAVRRGVDLSIGQEAVVNLRMEIGELSQTVTVVAEAPQVNTTTAPMSGLVTARQIKDLPLNGRSFDNLITLNPSAINFTLKSAGTSTSNGYTFSVAGRRPMDNIFLLNGIEYTGSSQLAITPGGVSGQLLGIDAVREFNVLSDTYSAEYGKRAGAQVAVVTQSGTNAVHGSAFEFLRNNVLNAPNYFDLNNVPPFRRNQFGGALGGAIKKNKTFVFGNYEGFRQSLAVTSVSVVPDDQARLGNLATSATTYAPAPNLNQAMLKYMALWPKANGAQFLINGIPTGAAISNNNPKQRLREDFGTIRGDHNFSDRDALNLAYTISDGDGLSPLADPLFASINVLRNQVASLQETHIFSPTVLNTFTAGFSRAAFNFDSALLADFPADVSFVSGASPGGVSIGGGVTTTGAGAITAGGSNPAAGVSNRRNLITFSDSVKMNKGIHQISMGVWFQRLRDNEDAASRRLGQATFASLTTFLQGASTNFQVVTSPTPLGWRSTFGSWYIEDVMKLRRNLTLQLGLRHEFTTGWNEVAGRAANYITDSTGNLATTPLLGNSIYTTNNAKKLFGPRAALAWDPFGNGKTAIRAGYGLYYSLIDNLAFLINSLPPYNGALQFATTVAAPLPTRLPIVLGTPIPPSCGVGVPTPCTTFAPQGIEAIAKTPAVNQWNFTIERELTEGLALRVAYVGSFGFHGLLSIDPNTIAPQICANAAGCASGGMLAANVPPGTVAQGVQYIPVQTTRPNPFVGAGFFWNTEGNSSYNGLQIDVTKRMAHGLQFRANYTWSKNLDMNSGLTGAQANNQSQMVLDHNDVRRDWGPSALNVAHQASFSAHYELPFGRGKTWMSSTGAIGEKIVGGWQVNAIATILSGFPFTPTVGANRSGDGNTRNPDRPDLAAGFSGPIVTGNPAQWFNPNAFVRPLQGTFGTLGRGVFSGPGLGSLDLSAFKNVVINDKINVQLRLEVFNSLDRANFGTPNPITFSQAAISPTAGFISGTATPSRQLQVGAKLSF